MPAPPSCCNRSLHGRNRLHPRDPHYGPAHASRLVDGQCRGRTCSSSCRKGGICGERLRSITVCHFFGFQRAAGSVNRYDRFSPL
jgi:hypothetical protein